MSRKATKGERRLMGARRGRGPVLIITKYPGWCEHCNKRIPAGTKVEWDTKRKVIAHLECAASKRKEAEERKQQEARLQEQEARLFQRAAEALKRMVYRQFGEGVPFHTTWKHGVTYICVNGQWYRMESGEFVETDKP